MLSHMLLLLHLSMHGRLELSITEHADLQVSGWPFACNLRYCESDTANTAEHQVRTLRRDWAG